MPSWFGLVSRVYLLPEREEKHFLEKEKYVVLNRVIITDIAIK